MSTVIHTLASVQVPWRVVEAPSYDLWREARHGLLTASDVAAVMGLSPYGSFERVLKDKLQPWNAAEGYVSSAMRAGTHLEGGVFAWWFEDAMRVARDRGEPTPTGTILRGAGGTSMLVAHPEARFRLAASPDALVILDARPRLVEIKVTNPTGWAKNWGDVGERIPKRWALYSNNPPPTLGLCPLRHWVQLQTQLLVTGVGEGFVVGCCGTVRATHRFEADPKFQLAIERASLTFWEAFDGRKIV